MTFTRIIKIHFWELLSENGAGIMSTYLMVKVCPMLWLLMRVQFLTRCVKYFRKNMFEFTKTSDGFIQILFVCFFNDNWLLIRCLKDSKLTTNVAMKAVPKSFSSPLSTAEAAFIQVALIWIHSTSHSRQRGSLAQRGRMLLESAEPRGALLGDDWVSPTSGNNKSC